MGTSNALTESENNGNEEANPSGTSVEAFYAATVVLITGATGFLGKALLEKLLRSCPRISTIYLLIRPKKNETIEQRFQQLMKNSVFDRIKWECPNAFSKVLPIKGDVSQKNLGLSDEDRIILTQQVNIVFHSAATVRFNEPLKVAVNLNTQGTERIIDLCTGMINLVSLVHVSTAYSNADLIEVKEDIYKTKIKPEILIDMCENLDDETLNILELKIRGQHPNTYTLTKGLAENIIIKKGIGLPIAIVRPSIVCAAYQEPFPGWVDNICGITGIMMQAGRGAVRSVVCDKNLIVDIIPVDYVVDTLICASWHSTMRQSKGIQVYNCVSGAFNPVKWDEFGHLVKKYAIELPSKYALWYPGFTLRTNKIIHKLVVTMLHFLPAFIVDIVLRCQGDKPVMMKTAKRYERAAKTAEFFSCREWKFHAENMNQLVKCVKLANDSNNFNVDITTLDWDAFVHKYTLGIRKYILKDNPDTLTKARNRLSKLYWIHRCAQVFFVAAMVKMVLTHH